jgi:hypothetical protein
MNFETLCCDLVVRIFQRLKFIAAERLQIILLRA